MTIDLYTDGGTIRRNPSKIGGTFAWVMVDQDDGEEIRRGDGAYTPEYVEMTVVGNNFAELYAAIVGIEKIEKHHGPGWNGILYTDSEVTRWRLTTGRSFEGVPQWLRLKTLEMRRCRSWTVKLVAGHPSKKEFLAGYVPHRKLACSKWNVLCDEMCQKKAAEFMEEICEK